MAQSATPAITVAPSSPANGDERLSLESGHSHEDSERGSPRSPHSPRSPERSRSRIRDLLTPDFQPSLVLQNTGSVARDHLASERTWLAYVRTSLAIASTGVAMVQLFTVAATSGKDDTDNSIKLNQRLQRFARPVGSAVIALGLLVLGVGIWRFFQIQGYLTKGMFPAARRIVVVLSTILALLVAIVFGVLASVSRKE